MLAKMGSISIEQATLYNRWCDIINDEGAYKIDMIGTIKDGVLETEQMLYSRIRFNEQQVEEQKAPTSETIKIKKRSSKSAYIYMSAAIVAIGAISAAYLYMYMNNNKQEVKEEVVVATQSVQPKKEEEVIIKKIDDTLAARFAAYPRPAKCYVEQGNQTEIRTYKAKTSTDSLSLSVLNAAMDANPEMASKRFQVVLCAYQYGSNAGRLIIDFREFYKENPIEVYALHANNMRVVALYGSNNELECEEYIRNYGTYISTALWISEVK